MTPAPSRLRLPQGPARAAERRQASRDLQIAAALSIPDVLREAGIDPVPVLARVGLALDLFDSPGNWIAFDALGHLTNECARVTGCEHFGLHVGDRFTLAAFGPLGELMRHSRTVEDALRGLVRYRHIGDRGGATALVNESPARAVLGYSVYSSTTPALRHIYDGATVIALRILRELCGPAWKPIEVTIPHNAPVDPSPFHQVFGPRVRFDADRSGVVFASRWLRHRIEGADPARCRDLEALLRRAASVEAGGMTEQVRRAMHSLSAAGTPRSGAVAGLLGLHERSLRRRLLDEGMTFQQLTRRVQFEIAQQLLEDTTLEVANVAAALHFSDATAFSRAFKSWSNMTPSAWRAGKRAKPARRLATLSSQPRDGR